MGSYRPPPPLPWRLWSPNDSASAIDAKVNEYFDAGASLVWVVYPGTRSVTAHRSPDETETLHEGAVLDGEPVFEDFQVPVSELFG